MVPTAPHPDASGLAHERPEGPAGDQPPLARTFGHGKVILLGEHAVVYDQPALAAGLSLGIWAEARDGTGTLTAPDWHLQARAGDATPLGQAFAAILRRLALPEVGVDIDVRIGGDLPPRAGLGSSAAIAIALARAIAGARGRDPEAALTAASDAEIIFHGTPSGIDLAAASSGAVGLFQRGVGWRPVPLPRSLTLCVGLTGMQRDTRTQVDTVRRLREGTPEIGALISSLGRVAVLGEQALRRDDLDELGRLFDLAHGLLCAMRVSSLELDTLVHQARAAGALGAKLTGAGGGGAVIALAPGHEQDVLERWSAAGYAGFLAQIGPTSPLLGPSPLPSQSSPRPRGAGRRDPT